MNLNLHKPCNACPFRRNAPPGWLGPWDAEDLVRSLAYFAFPCHRTIPEGGAVLDDPAYGLPKDLEVAP